jgi:hypothetical protein
MNRNQRHSRGEQPKGDGSNVHCNGRAKGGASCEYPTGYFAQSSAASSVELKRCARAMIKGKKIEGKKMETAERPCPDPLLRIFLPQIFLPRL